MADNEREVLTEMLLAMDKYDLYGKMAIPRKHDFEYEVPAAIHVSPEAAEGGLIGLLRDGDTIRLDIEAHTLEADVAADAMAALLASLYPAWRASRSHPAPQLREE